VVSQNGMTPLHHAADKGVSEVVEFLISLGGGLNIEDNVLLPLPQ